MATSFSSLWLKSIKRLTKAPRAQARRSVKSAVKKTVRSIINTALGVKKRVPAASTSSRKTIVKAKVMSAAQTHQPSTAVKSLRTKTGVLPAGATWQKAYFSSPATPITGMAQRMAYWLYIPAPAASVMAKSGPMPLVVLLHGCKQTATDIATATRMNALAERKGFAVLYPHQSASADRNRCWS